MQLIEFNDCNHANNWLKDTNNFEKIIDVKYSAFGDEGLALILIIYVEKKEEK